MSYLFDLIKECAFPKDIKEWKHVLGPIFARRIRKAQLSGEPAHKILRMKTQAAEEISKSKPFTRLEKPISESMVTEAPRRWPLSKAEERKLPGIVRELEGRAKHIRFLEKRTAAREMLKIAIARAEQLESLVTPLYRQAPWLRRISKNQGREVTLSAVFSDLMAGGGVH